jgi:DNA invertase Pin-like site-specific DNA recombinase
VRKIGYARVSSQGQNLDRQIAALRTEGCGVIYCEKARARACGIGRRSRRRSTSSASATVWC